MVTEKVSQLKNKLFSARAYVPEATFAGSVATTTELL
jgi:hypothetical protein